MSAPDKGAAKDGSSLAETVSKNLEARGVHGATGNTRTNATGTRNTAGNPRR